MKKKNKGNFRAGLIIVVGTLAFILMLIFIYKNKNKKDISPVINSTPELSLPEKKDGVTPLTEEKKAELKAIRNITGKITAINDDSIDVIRSNGDALTLNIPDQGVNFVKESAQKDGSFLNEKIELSSVPKNKQINIQYNSTTNNVMLIVVK